MTAAIDNLLPEGRQRAWDTQPFDEHSRSGAERLAMGLGWLSIGFGAAEVVAPGALAQLMGIRPTTKTNKAIRALGLRKVANGVSLLSRPSGTGWMWSRLGSDTIDLAYLGQAFRGRRNDRGRLAAATAAILGIAALNLLVGRRLRDRSSQGGSIRGGSKRSKARGIQVSRAIRIQRSPEDVYRFWRSLENLPRFMDHVTSVRELDDRHSRWRAKAPANMTVEWTAEIITDIPNERIAWRSLPGADVPNEGAVRFTPAAGGNETEVHVELRYDPPAGALGAAVARLFGEEPHQQIGEDLRRLRQIMEAAERVNPTGAPV